MALDFLLKVEDRPGKRGKVTVDAPKKRSTKLKVTKQPKGQLFRAIAAAAKQPGPRSPSSLKLTGLSPEEQRRRDEANRKARFEKAIAASKAEQRELEENSFIKDFIGEIPTTGVKARDFTVGVARDTARSVPALEAEVAGRVAEATGRGKRSDFDNIPVEGSVAKFLFGDEPIRSATGVGEEIVGEGSVFAAPLGIVLTGLDVTPGGKGKAAKTGLKKLFGKKNAVNFVSDAARKRSKDIVALSDDVTESIARDVSDIVEQGVRTNKSVPKMTKEISQVIDDAVIPKNKIQAELATDFSKVVEDVVDGPKKALATNNSVSKELKSLSAPTPPGKALKPAPSTTKTTAETVIEKLNRLKESDPERLIAQSRGRSRQVARGVGAGEGKTGAEQFKAQKAALKGKLTENQIDSLTDTITPDDVDGLMDQIENTPLQFFEKVRAKEALSKLVDGELPAPAERKLLSRSLGEDFLTALEPELTKLQKLKEAGLEIANIPRSIMSSGDLSASFRQGLVLGARNPKEFGRAFKNQFKFWKDENVFEESMAAIRKRPTYNSMVNSGLDLTDIGKMSKREEAFMSSWAERIPLVGRLIKASGRAYTGFLNQLRADTYDKILRDAHILGRDVGDVKLQKSISNFVNAASGRGSLGKGKLEAAAPALNSVLFSPRLIASRLSLLNPKYYADLDPLVRKHALQSMGAVLGTAGTVVGLSKAAGADVELDPTSSDFGKIKVGNTRIDPWGGFQQYVVLASRLIENEKKSSTTGKITEFGEGFKPETRLSTILRFGGGKLAPVPSGIRDALAGVDFQGEPFNMPDAVATRIVPLVTQDAWENLGSEGPEAVLATILAALGVGTQTYEPDNKSSSSSGSSSGRVSRPSRSGSSGRGGRIKRSR